MPSHLVRGRQPLASFVLLLRVALMPDAPPGNPDRGNADEMLTFAAWPRIDTGSLSVRAFLGGIQMMAGP